MGDQGDQGDPGESGGVVTLRVRVTGEVQGVGYRWHAAQQAGALGLVGWVRNELDGAVSAHLEGPSAAVSSMVAWCREGPPSARVSDVESRPAEPSGARSFQIHP